MTQSKGKGDRKRKRNVKVAVSWQYVLEDGTPAQRRGKTAPETFEVGIDPNESDAFYPGSLSGWFRRIIDPEYSPITDPLTEQLQHSTTPGVRANGSATVYQGVPDPDNQLRWIRDCTVVPQDLATAQAAAREVLAEEMEAYRAAGVAAVADVGPVQVAIRDRMVQVVGAYLQRSNLLVVPAQAGQNDPLNVASEGVRLSFTPMQATQLFDDLVSAWLAGDEYEGLKQIEIRDATLEQIPGIIDGIDPATDLGAA